MNAKMRWCDSCQGRLIWNPDAEDWEHAETGTLLCPDFTSPGNFVRMLSEIDKARRLRRLIKIMCRQALLSDNEAVSAIIAHRQGDGRYGGAEAVVHYGGATKIIRESIRHRGWWMHSIYGRWEDE